MNYKLRVTKTESIKVQIHLFSLDIEWAGKGKEIFQEDEPYLYFNNLFITFSKETEGMDNYFDKHGAIEITPDQLLQMSFDDLEKGNILGENKDVSQFKVGDEVWIKCKIIKDYNDGDLSLDTNSFHSDGSKSEIVYQSRLVYKTLPADQQTINKTKEHVNPVLDPLSDSSPDTAQTIDNYHNTMYRREPKAAIMWGDCDMSEEIKDEMILKGRDNRNNDE